MLQLNMADFHWVTSGLAELKGISQYADPNKTRPIEDDLRVDVGKLADKLAEHLLTLGARVTSLGVARLKVALTDSATSWETFASLVDDINKRLLDELSGKKVIVLQDREDEYFNARQPLFGQEVSDKFQSSAAFEIDEAAKCLALGRSTAAVFHLMRTMEIGIRALARSLSVPDPVKPAERNWGHILNAIWDGIEAKWPRTSDRLHGDGALFEDLYVSLDAVKNPWRNSTMHVEKKYTDEEAEHVFMAVRGFMRKLASRLDENGQPLA